MTTARRDPPPYYRLHVFCCVNRRPDGHPHGCCASKGASELREHLKARVKELGLEGVRINASGCLGRCGLGPLLVVYPEGVWYGYANVEDLEEILRRHLIEGGRVERLMLAPETTEPPR